MQTGTRARGSGRGAMRAKPGRRPPRVLCLGLVGLGLLPPPVSAQEPRLRAALRGHTAPVRSVAFSPDRKTLASADVDGTIRLWEVATGKGRAPLQGHLNLVGSVAFSPDGKTLASAGWDR